MNRPTRPGPASLRYKVFLAVYSGALALSKPLIWNYFRRRSEGDAAYGMHLGERCGEGAPFAADMWVHAVSLGEMKSAEPLVRMALAAGYRVITTHATPAGRRAAETGFAEEIAAGQVAVRYAPVDRLAYWRRFFATYQPRVGLVMEMEFWPAMLEAAAEAGCLACLANSQVPAKSFPRAERLARLFGHPVARAAAVFAKSDAMAARFRTLGARDVRVLGETRFDIPLPEAQLAAGAAIGAGRSVVTLASVVEGEEEGFVSLVQSLMADADPPLVIWVPRAPELFDATYARLVEAGLQVIKRSEAFDGALAPVQSLDAAQVVVGDSLGEMFFYLSPADAVIVGGGFVEKGAHNVIEPLSLGKPVLTGPHVWTIEFPGVEAEAAGVLTIVKSADDLADAVRVALAGGGGEAEVFHSENKGASRRIFEAIRPVLEGP